MIYTPEMNDGRHVFVFGSNLAGIHGAGAAKEAMEHWGAVWHFARGRKGMSYAIPTKRNWRDKQGLPLVTIERYVKEFLEYARRRGKRESLKFLVTAIGTGLAGHKEVDIIPLFADAPANCVLPEGWRNERSVVQ